MAINNPYSQYQEQSILTATPEELTLMLYNGCIKFMTLAELAIEKKDMPSKNENLQKAQAIIAELEATVDMSYDVSKNLWQLYDFCMDKLISANIENDIQAVSDAKDVIISIRDGWKEAMVIARKGSSQ